jgi:inner membrane protein
MDTVTHAFAGSVLARSASDQAETRLALLVGGLAAVVPDLDFLFFSTRIDYLKDHRSWTHSFLVLPFLALAIALATKVFARRARLWRLWLFAAVGIASHILFDWITSFGTMFWTPISRTRYSLDWVFILDPIFTGIVLAALIASLVFRRRARTITIAGSAALAAYIGFCAVMHARALAAWKRMDHPPPGARVAALPQFLSPFRWLGLSDNGNVLHYAFFDVGPFARGSSDARPPRRWSEILQSLSDSYPPPKDAKIVVYPAAEPSKFLSAARGLPDWKIYLGFARFPMETVYPAKDGGADVIVQDLRFLPWFTGPWERGGKEGLRRQPFVYRARFDAGLNVIDRGFVRDGRR